MHWISKAKLNKKCASWGERNINKIGHTFIYIQLYILVRLTSSCVHNILWVESSKNMFLRLILREKIADIQPWANS